MVAQILSGIHCENCFFSIKEKTVPNSGFVWNANVLNLDLNLTYQDNLAAKTVLLSFFPQFLLYQVGLRWSSGLRRQFFVLGRGWGRGIESQSFYFFYSSPNQRRSARHEKRRKSTKGGPQRREMAKRGSGELKQKNRQAFREWSSRRRYWFGKINLIKWSTPINEECGAKNCHTATNSDHRIIYILNTK